MLTRHETAKVPLDSIKVLPNRQRKSVGDVKSLADSIFRVGLLNPIVLSPEYTLVAGERRLEAFKLLRASHPQAQTYLTIPCNFTNQLTQGELQLLELDENIRRQDISWQETLQAVQGIHTILLEDAKAKGLPWTGAQTSSYIGLNPSTTAKYLRVSLASQTSPKLLECPTINSALQTMERAEERKQNAHAATISEVTKKGLASLALPSISSVLSVLDQDFPDQGDLPLSEPAPLEIPTLVEVLPAKESILVEDCKTYLSHYSGPAFNLIHCDFPYGIDYTGWDNSAEHMGGYDDSPEVYWDLVASLCANWDHIAQPACHLMFWLSMDYYSETVEYLTKRIPDLTLNPKPLIWHKTDNKGNLPDHRRGPRQVYETALFGYTGDRKIVKPVSNAYGAPTQKSLANHISEKPEPVLRYFFQMLVDETTSLLDPTCGGGSALRAAESLGASRVLGLEKNQEYANSAILRLDQARTLSKMKV